METKVRHKKINYSKYGLIFIMPFIIVFLVFQAYPIYYTFYLAFNDIFSWENRGFAGLDNFIRVLNDRTFWDALKVTLKIWGYNFVFQVSLAMLLAVMFTNRRYNIKGKGIAKVLMYLPGTITAATIGVFALAMVRYPGGALYAILTDLGFNITTNLWQSPAFIQSVTSGLLTWMWYGNTMIILIAGINGINEELYESAEIDGASNIKSFTHITVPLLRPILLYIFVTSLVGGLQMFDIPFTLINAPFKPTLTSAAWIYERSFTGERLYSIGAAGSIIMLFITTIISIFLFFILKDQSKDKSNKKGV